MPASWGERVSQKGYRRRSYVDICAWPCLEQLSEDDCICPLQRGEAGAHSRDMGQGIRHQNTSRTVPEQPGRQSIPPQLSAYPAPAPAPPLPPAQPPAPGRHPVFTCYTRDTYTHVSFGPHCKLMKSAPFSGEKTRQTSGCLPDVSQ